MPRNRPLARATFIPSRVRILMRSDSNSATIARTLNSSRPTGSVGSWTEPPRLSLTPARGELVDDVAGVRQRPGEPVELGDHERVASTARGECLAQPGPGAVGAGQAMVDVDPVRLNPECGEGVTLGGEVLAVGGQRAYPMSILATG